MILSVKYKKTAPPKRSRNFKNSGRLLLDSVNADFLAILAHSLELDVAVDESEEGVIRTLADIVAGMDVGSALSDKDIACENELTVASLDAESLGLRITAVLGRTRTLLMCKKLYINLQHDLHLHVCDLNIRRKRFRQFSQL